MSEEILVNVTPMETRVAVVENGATQDIYIERSASRGVVGNIYAGKVRRVLPGMQAAFVDIGLERNSFIHVSDIVESDTASISEQVHDGKKIIVQVTKDPLGTKGARLTMQLSTPYRAAACSLSLMVAAFLATVSGSLASLSAVLQASYSRAGCFLLFNFDT